MGDRRERLLAAAARLFVQYGFRKTSVEDVTRAAGVSKGAFYLELKSKEELFSEVVAAEFRAYLTDVEQRVLSDPEGGRLSHIYRHSIRALLERDFLRALYTQADDAFSALLHQRGPARYGPRVLLGADFIGQLQTNGLVRDEIPPAELSHTLMVLSLGPLLAEPLLHSEDSPPLDKTLTTIGDMIVQSYEAPSDDVAAGKRAFKTLVSRAMADLDPSAGNDSKGRA